MAIYFSIQEKRAQSDTSGSEGSDDSGSDDTFIAESRDSDPLLSQMSNGNGASSENGHGTFARS